MRYLWTVLLATVASAQPVVPARVSGSTLNAGGGALRRSVVRLVGAKMYTQVSDEQGNFVFVDVEPGRYSLMASRRGYYSQKFGARAPLSVSCEDVEYHTDRLTAYLQQCVAAAPGATLNLTAGQELKDLRLSLAPMASLSGRVVNQDGDPVTGWTVYPLKLGYKNGKRELVAAPLFDNMGRTDTSGNFSLDGMAPGRYYLWALLNKFPALGFPGKPQPEADLATYYPAEADASRAVPVEIAAGGEVQGIEIHVRRAKVFSIRGKVSAPPNSNVGTQSLTLSLKEGEPAYGWPNQASVNAAGMFEFQEVEAGHYVILAGRAAANRGMPPPLFGRTEVRVTADVDGVVLSMGPGITVGGTIRVEGKKPTEWPFITLLAVDGENGSYVRGVDSKGAFQFPQPVAPGPLHVRVDSVGPGLYLKSVTYGGQDALRAPLDLTGAPAGSLDIVLSSNVARISGKVTNEKGDPAGGVVVSVWPRKPNLLEAVKSASTDRDGNFEIGDLAPGEYLVAGLEEIDPAFGQAMDFLQRLPGLASVVLEEGGHGSVDVKLISRERIAAEVAKLR